MVQVLAEVNLAGQEEDIRHSCYGLLKMEVEIVFSFSSGGEENDSTKSKLRQRQQNITTAQPEIPSARLNDMLREGEEAVNDIVLSFTNAITAESCGSYKTALMNVVEEEGLCQQQLMKVIDAYNNTLRAIKFHRTVNMNLRISQFQISENWNKICGVKSPEDLHEVSSYFYRRLNLSICRFRHRP